MLPWRQLSHHQYLLFYINSQVQRHDKAKRRHQEATNAHHKHRAAGHNEENTVFTEKVNLGPLFAGCMTWCSGTCWARCGEAKMRWAVCSTEHHACPGRQKCAQLLMTTPLPIGRPTVVTDDDLLGLWESGCHFYVYFVTVFWRWSCFP